MKPVVFRSSGNNLTAGDLRDINRLLSGLNPSPKKVNAKILKEVLEDGEVLVVREREKGRIVGIGALFVHRTLTAKIGRIEDVVVDKGVQHRGIGGQLIEGLILKAKELGVEYLELNCAPKCVSAARLYKKHGFKPMPTNSYRYVLS